MAVDERNATGDELKDVRTGAGPAGTHTVVGQGKVQKGDASVTTDEPKDNTPEGAEDKVAVMVNSDEFNGSVGVPYEEDGVLKTDDFEPGKVHYVKADTAELTVGGKRLFVPADAE
jgi:hypothetical protein